MSLMTLFFADGRVERHEVDEAQPTFMLSEPMRPIGLPFNNSFLVHTFALRYFDIHVRLVGSKARWEVYIEGERDDAVLAGARAAGALGCFMEWVKA